MLDITYTQRDNGLHMTFYASLRQNILAVHIMSFMSDVGPSVYMI